MMERRGFLKGLLGSVTAAGIIVEATPADVERFAGVRGAPVALAAVPAMPMELGEYLFNEAGQRVAIITEVTSFTPWIDATPAAASERVIVAGLPQMELHALVLGPVRLLQRGKR